MDSSRARSRGVTAVALGLVFAGLIALVLWLPRGPTQEPGAPDDGQPAPDEAAPGEPERPGSRWPLTGVPTDEVPDRPALVVKVSNSPEARPQTGLEAADVVLEEVTEAGITRFVSIFHSQLPAVVGPVRSARPVDVQIVSGFGRPGVAFSGARPEVRAAFASAPAVTITEGAPGFFRDDGTYASHPVAPHDLFLRIDEALAAVRAGGARPLADLGWAFADGPPSGGRAAPELEVAMSTRFTTTWSYDAAAGVYRRAQDGVPSEVTGPGRIGAANVVVLAVRHYVGASGYPETDVIGTGAGLVLRDGARHEIRWSKPTAVAPLLLLGRDGRPFALAPGPTWILLPDHLPVPDGAS